MGNARRRKAKNGSRHDINDQSQSQGERSIQDVKLDKLRKPQRPSSLRQPAKKRCGNCLVVMTVLLFALASSAVYVYNYVDTAPLIDTLKVQTVVVIETLQQKYGILLNYNTQESPRRKSGEVKSDEKSKETRESHDLGREKDIEPVKEETKDARTEDGAPTGKSRFSEEGSVSDADRDGRKTQQSAEKRVVIEEEEIREKEEEILGVGKTKDGISLEEADRDVEDDVKDSEAVETPRGRRSATSGEDANPQVASSGADTGIDTVPDTGKTESPGAEDSELINGPPNDNIEHMEEDAVPPSDDIEQTEQDAVPSNDNIEQAEEDAVPPSDNIEQTEEKAEPPSDDLEQTEDEAEPFSDNIEKTEDEAELRSDDIEQMDEGAEPPSDHIEQMEEEAEPPSDHIEQSEDKAEQPSDDIEHTEDEAEPPSDYIEQMEEEAEPPSDYIEQTEEEAEPPSDNIEQTEDKAEPSKDDIEQTEDKAEPSKDDIEQTEDKAEPSKDDVEQTEDKAEPSKDDIEQTEDKAEPSKDDIEQTEDKAEPSKDDIEQTEDKAEPSKDDIEQTEDKAEPSKDDVEQTEDKAEPSKDDIEQTEDKAEPSKDDIEQTEDKAEPSKDDIEQTEDKAEPSKDDIEQMEDEAQSPSDNVEQMEDEAQPSIDNIEQMEEVEPPSDDIEQMEDEAQPPSDDIEQTEDEAQPPSDDIKQTEDEAEPSSDDIEQTEQEAVPPGDKDRYKTPGDKAEHTPDTTGEKEQESMKTQVKQETEDAADVTADSSDEEDQSGSHQVRYHNAHITNQEDFEIREKLDAADKLLQQKQIQEGRVIFEQLLSLHPQSPRATYGRALALDIEADLYRSNALLEQAITEYLRVLELPDVPKALMILSGRKCSTRQTFRGWVNHAVTTMKKIVTLFPEELDLWSELGVQYLIRGSNNEAREAFLQVLQRRPDDGFAKVHLGFIIKVVDRDYNKSIPYLQQGIDSGVPGTIDGRFFVHLGDALYRVGRHNEAQKVYDLGYKKGVFMSPLQRSLHNVERLSAHPWWTAEETGVKERFKLLEENWEVIRDEGLAQLNDTTGAFELEAEDLRDKGEWRQFTLYRQGHKVPKNCRRTPKTCELLDQFPEATSCKRGQIKYSVMHPGIHVWPHCGPTNCRIRAHLGLVVPPGLRIRVVNETRSWTEGRFIVFDDSFEHEVWHEGNSLRLVLIVDIWHPELTTRERTTLPPI